ncbi:hypothetical protein [Halosimplex pelagicum]|uniref:Protein kinase domain-containing protein n=1 Tax=Halosimplex pelagicum TaxID=869886 RepID=A0A7D5P900_9EURY|nr:hypothetical protein [Halosimplex pelagicum]QLH83766.1 hypothetical protein HZS54_19975 [Halosimplex pelagicum]
MGETEVIETGTLTGEVVSGQISDYRLGERIGSGQEGEVYRLQGPEESVVKVFGTDCRAEKADKVRAMVQPENQPADPTYQQEGVRSIIWPQNVVEDTSGQFLGYKMPEKDLDEALDALSYAMFELTWDNSTDTKRLGAALNLSIMIDAVHKQGHAIGDFNHENILVEGGYISLIDCDAFHINADRATYGGDTYFPRYAPPEKRPDALSEVQLADRFGLGIYVFQLLMEGSHPFLAQGPSAATGSLQDMIQENSFPYETSSDGIEPHDGKQTKYDQLPNQVQARFRDCFVAGKRDSSKRPTPGDWIETLSETSGLGEPGGSRADVDRDTQANGATSSSSTAPNQTGGSGAMSRTASHSIRDSEDGRISRLIKRIAPNRSQPRSSFAAETTTKSRLPRIDDTTERLGEEVRRVAFFVGGLLALLLLLYMAASIN